MSFQDWFGSHLALDDEEEDYEYNDEEELDAPIPKPKKRSKRRREEDEEDAIASGPTIVGSINRKGARGARGNAMNSEREADEKRPEIVMLEPREYEEAKAIVDNLNEDISVILKLENLDMDLALRILDFTIGASYAMGGNMAKITQAVFIVTPNATKLSTSDLKEFGENVDLSGLDLNMR